MGLWPGCVHFMPHSSAALPPRRNVAMADNRSGSRTRTLAAVHSSHLTVVAVLGLVLCSLGVCRAAVIPTQPDGTPPPSTHSEQGVSPRDAPQQGVAPQAAVAAPAVAPPKTFLGPASSAPSGIASSSSGAVDQPVRAAGLLQRGPERALDGYDPLAAPADVAARPPLDAPDARVRHDERDAAHGGQRMVAPHHAMGVEMSETGHDVGVKPKDADRVASPASILEVLLATLQAHGLPALVVASDKYTLTHVHPFPATDPHLPHRGHGQTRPKKTPVFSDSYLPPLVQVLTHVVDALEERELMASEAVAATTPITPDTDMAATDVSASTGDVDKPTPPAATQGPLVLVDAPAAAVQPAAQEIIIEVPVQSVIDILSQVAGSGPVTIVENGKDLPADFSKEENGDFARNVPAVGAQDASEQVIKDATKEIAKDVKEVAVNESRNDATKYVAEKATNVPKPIAKDEDDEDMQEDMPVVQRDVPIVNEETVPMMMMINMVPSDAPEMVMDMPMASNTDGADEEEGKSSGTHSDTAVARSKRNAPLELPDEAYLPEEFATYVTYPILDTIETSTALGRTTDVVADILDKTAFEDLKDNAFLLNSIRGEAAAVGKRYPTKPPSPSLLKLVKLRFALGADAKRQSFKTIQGFSDRVLADLIPTSSWSAREQMGSLLTTVLELDQIKSDKTKKRAAALLDELREEDSALTKALEGIPALKYAP